MVNLKQDNQISLPQQKGFGEALIDLAEEFKNLIVLTGDTARSGNLLDFKKNYPERFFDVGISEMNMAAMAAGLSTTGFIPVIHSFAMFAAARPFEIIRNAIAYPNLNVKITATHAGLNVGADGVTHQAIEDIAILRSVPNFVLLVPSDAVEVKLALKAALEYQGPVYLRMGRAKTPVITTPYKFIIGKANVLKDGSDVCLFSNGFMVDKCLQACKLLEQEGISSAVVNMHTVKPIDVDSILHFARQTGAIVTAEEHSRIGGLGSAVAEILSSRYPVPLQQVAIDDCFAESGSPNDLFEKYGLTVDKIVSCAKKSIKMKNMGKDVTNGRR